jgi:hypothetical protein
MTGFRMAALFVAIMLGAITASRLVAQERTLTAADVDDAIRLGETGQPAPYLLHNKQREDTVNNGVMAVVYTPFVRVALAAKVAWDEGRHLEKDNISPALLEPVAYVAFRWYCCVDSDHGDRWNWHPRTPPFDYDVATPASARGWGVIARPLWVRRDLSLLDEIGGIPYDDIVLIAGYPMSVLSQPSDFGIYRSWPSPIDPRHQDTGMIVGRVTAADVRGWR